VIVFMGLIVGFVAIALVFPYYIAPAQYGLLLDNGGIPTSARATCAFERREICLHRLSTR
jgi:hypothetical protein